MHSCSNEYGDNVGNPLLCEEMERVLLRQLKVLQDTKAAIFPLENSFSEYLRQLLPAASDIGCDCSWSDLQLLLWQIKFPRTHGLEIPHTAITRSRIGHRVLLVILSRERSSWTGLLTQNLKRKCSCSTYVFPTTSIFCFNTMLLIVTAMNCENCSRCSVKPSADTFDFVLFLSGLRLLPYYLGMQKIRTGAVQG